MMSLGEYVLVLIAMTHTLSHLGVHSYPPRDSNGLFKRFVQQL
jgi:hypothetical protein